jgi:hypothetical protein
MVAALWSLVLRLRRKTPHLFTGLPDGSPARVVPFTGPKREKIKVFLYLRLQAEIF